MSIPKFKDYLVEASSTPVEELYQDSIDDMAHLWKRGDIDEIVDGFEHEYWDDPRVEKFCKANRIDKKELFDGDYKDKKGMTLRDYHTESVDAGLN